MHDGSALCPAGWWVDPVIPAILYFASAFWMVHLEAGKYDLIGMKPFRAHGRRW